MICIKWGGTAVKKNRPYTLENCYCVETVFFAKITLQKNMTPTMQDIVSLCKRRGFVYQTSEIYGGLANSYDYGPMGSELMRNIRNLWWQEMIQKRRDMIGIDSQIMLHPQTWVASGHVGAFTDPLVEDKVNNKRYRADHLIEAWLEKQTDPKFKTVVIEDLNTTQMNDFIKENKIKSPEGNEITEAMDFKLLFESSIGSVAGKKAVVYLRGETAQGIFTNFKQILDSTRITLPFGVGQIGKSFRNEITTGQFVFRTIEFEQGEIEYFFDPEETDWKQLFKDWQTAMEKFVCETIGIDRTHIRWRQHTDKERSFYSKDTWDLQYQYTFGWQELWGVAYRTDYDLKQHMQFSEQSLEYVDPQTGKKFVPHVIEPALGINRLFLMILTDAYFYDEEKKRLVLKLSPKIAPYKAAVFPLVKNKPEIVTKAQELYQTLSNKYAVAWDSRGNIGKRYFAQDEIGTPFCVTVDYDTIEKGLVTIRNRDTAQQEQINISEVEKYLAEKLS